MKTVLILGFGLTGKSLVEWAQAKHLNGFWVADMLPTPLPGADGFTCIDSSAFIEKPEQVDAVLASPGFSPSHPILLWAAQNNIPVRGDLSLLLEQVTRPVILVTGTNGKSTVVTLVSELLKAQGLRVGLGGNIGKPCLSLLAQPVDVYVVEVSSFQLWATPNVKSEVAAILNITPDHLNWHGSFEAYAAAKWAIGQNTARLVLSDKLCQQAENQGYAECAVNFEQASEAQPYYVKDNSVYKASDLLLSLADLSPSLQGKHNLQNVLAALAIAEPWLCSMTAVQSVLCHFKGLPYRCQSVATLNGVRWVNDSKGTNVGSTIAAIEGLALRARKNIVLIAGGVGKGADFTQLGQCVEQHCHAVVLFGQSAGNIAEALPKSTDVQVVETLSQACNAAQRWAREGDLVLFSPACASFDQFAHFEARGEAFNVWVKQNVVCTAPR